MPAEPAKKVNSLLCHYVYAFLIETDYRSFWLTCNISKYFWYLTVLLEPFSCTLFLFLIPLILGSPHHPKIYKTSTVFN